MACAKNAMYYNQLNTSLCQKYDLARQQLTHELMTFNNEAQLSLTYIISPPDNHGIVYNTLLKYIHKTGTYADL